MHQLYLLVFHHTDTHIQVLYFVLVLSLNNKHLDKCSICAHEVDMNVSGTALPSCVTPF
jgi:hypothetical protein